MISTKNARGLALAMALLIIPFDDGQAQRKPYPLLSLELGVDYALTHSCYDPGPDGRPCGACDSCLLRRKGFEEAGIEDR